ADAVLRRAIRQPQHRHRRLRPARARLLERGAHSHAACPGGRSARPPVLHLDAGVDQLVGRRHAFAVRRADDPGARDLHVGRPAAARRRQLEDAQPALGSRLHPRPALVADRRLARRRIVFLRRLGEYFGTYTFENMEAFEAGRPRSFTIRTGDPNIRYWNLQAGMYIQDDVRVRKNLTLSTGVRYELQTHLSDYNNVGPRFGVTWSPGKAGKTTLRGSAGIFYDWLSSGTYEQTLRVDGFRQRELNVPDPTFPVTNLADLGF